MYTLMITLCGFMGAASAEEASRTYATCSDGETLVSVSLVEEVYAASSDEDLQNSCAIALGHLDLDDGDRFYEITEIDTEEVNDVILYHVDIDIAPCPPCEKFRMETRSLVEDCATTDSEGNFVEGTITSTERCAVEQTTAIDPILGSCDCVPTGEETCITISHGDECVINEFEIEAAW